MTIETILWEPIFEKLANGTVILGNASNVIKAAQAECALQVKLFATSSEANFIATTTSCAKVLYSNDNVGCLLSSFLATNDSAPYYTFSSNPYFVSTMVNLNGPTVESRYFSGGNPVPPIPVTEQNYHTQWLTGLVCTIFEQNHENVLLGSEHSQTPETI